MRGLIVQSPYIGDILSGVKNLEIRGRNTKIRGTIVLLQCGTNLALGTVDIIDSRQISLEEYNNWEYRRDNNRLPDNALPYPRTFAYTLANPHRYESPKEYNHPRGAVTWVRLPDDF